MCCCFIISVYIIKTGSCSSNKNSTQIEKSAWIYFPFWPFPSVTPQHFIMNIFFLPWFFIMYFWLRFFFLLWLKFLFWLQWNSHNTVYNLSVYYFPMHCTIYSSSNKPLLIRFSIFSSPSDGTTWWWDRDSRRGPAKDNLLCLWQCPVQNAFQGYLVKTDPPKTFPCKRR